MGSAQLEFVAGEDTATPAAQQPPPSALRQQVAERLAAHRERRERQGVLEAKASEAQKTPKHRVAAAVAERYAQTPSYRAFLAEQARRAVEEAAAAAEIAMRNAEAVAAAQQELLGELELWNAPQEFTPETAKIVSQIVSQVVSPAAEPNAERAAEPPAPTPTARQATPKPAKTPAPERPAGGITVRLYEDLRQVPPAARPPAQKPKPNGRTNERDAEEAIALDAEIAFRQAPVFDEFWIDPDPLVPLPANLLEFPRQLVAARKARPRLAEGPLREEITPRTAQLRIFEVEPEQIATTPAPMPAAPEWTSIHLDSAPLFAPQPATAEPAPNAPAMPLLASLLPPQTAPLQLRLMSGLVDAMLVCGAALACVAIFARIAVQVPLGVPAALAGAGLLLVMHILYQLLFFTFSDQTPGMRYARLGLCSFSDENPTRAAMRRRILAQFVAVCPLGLGLLWIVLDDDGLGWHDRISKMYQRAY
jgi:uncharacterized RDD family membrane protein YckC